MIPAPAIERLSRAELASLRPRRRRYVPDALDCRLSGTVTVRPAVVRLDLNGDGWREVTVQVLTYEDVTDAGREWLAGRAA